MGYSRTPLRTIRFAVFAAVIVLSAIATRSASAAYSTLMWTSPSDGGTARVYYYDLRINTKAIAGTDTLGWWNAATKISMAGKTPSMPGSGESILLGGLINGARYYAIMRSADSQLNWSNYSNVASFTAVTAISAVNDNSPAPEMVLGIPRPTPTSGRAEVNLDLPKTMDVNASVYDAQGRLVQTLEHGTLAAGTHVLRWDGRVDGGGNAASGVYWILASAGPVSKRVKLIVVR
jgi:hypothetical protein